MTVKVYVSCLLLTPLLIEGSKYIVETEGNIFSSSLNNFVEVEELGDSKVETEIERSEVNPISGDYSSPHDECSIKLVCKAPSRSLVKSGSCHFT